MTKNTTKLNLALFISGKGSNLNSILKACKGEDYPATVSFVLSNNPDAPGLELAKKEGIETAICNHKDFQNRADFEKAIIDILPDRIDIICLAGFMRILSPFFIEHWHKPVLNIHPSLLPLYKGLNPQKQALEDGAVESGCSVHFVTKELDAGPVIVQRHVSIEDGETEASLSQKILLQEHIAYPEAIRIVAGTLSGYTS